MSTLLDESNTVLWVGEPPHRLESARDSGSSGRSETASVRTGSLHEAGRVLPSVDVFLVDSRADALEALDTRTDVGCVVTSQSLPDATGVDLCRAVGEREPELPVVFYAEDAVLTDGAVVRAALNAGAVGWYTRSDPLGDLSRAVEDALETARRRRLASVESGLFTTLLDSMGISVYVKDEQARYVLLADVPGNANPEDAMGKTDLDLYGDQHPTVARQAYEDDVRVIREGTPVFDRDERYGDAKTAKWVRTTKVPWRDEEGTIRGLLGMTREVTEFKRQEEELESLRRQFDRFSANVRHDLKNPLQVATGHLELGRESGDEGSFDLTNDALERMAEIIADLDSLAKGHSQVETPTVTDPTALIDSVWNVLLTHDVTLENEFSPTAQTVVPEQTLRPLFENLFKNAVAHGGHGVTVRVGPLDGGFYVEDTGPGIPESEREAVLEAGYTTVDDGMGMGLNIVSDIADREGWDLTVGQSLEGGARFEFTRCPFVSRLDTSLRGGTHTELTTATDVGTLECESTADYDPATDRWTVVADGQNIWGPHNDFHFVHAVVDGSVRIQGRVVDLEHVHGFSKAGVMIRNDLGKESTYGFVGTTPAYGTEVLWRAEDGGDATSQQLEESHPPTWFRVDRLGDRLTTSLSRDGAEWTAVDQRTVSLDEQVHAGVVVCSTVSGRACRATFEDVSVVELLEGDGVVGSDGSDGSLEE